MGVNFNLTSCRKRGLKQRKYRKMPFKNQLEERKHQKWRKKKHQKTMVTQSMFTPNGVNIKNGEICENEHGTQLKKKQQG